MVAGFFVPDAQRLQDMRQFLQILEYTKFLASPRAGLFRFWPRHTHRTKLGVLLGLTYQ